MKALVLSLICAAATASPLADDSQVPYPPGYRDWHHVKSMVIEDGHPLFASFGGIHHLYANNKAMKGYRGKSFPDGAVISSICWKPCETVTPSPKARARWWV